jgi:hypothetical protein
MLFIVLNADLQDGVQFSRDAAFPTGHAALAWIIRSARLLHAAPHRTRLSCLSSLSTPSSAQLLCSREKESS